MNTNFMNQSIETGKTWFDAAFTAGTRLQDQNEQVFRRLMDQLPWMDENAKKNLDAWLNSYKQSRDAVKKAVDENYVNIEKMLNTP